MPKLRNLANRTKELEIFLKMAAGDHECCIMFVEGSSGMGKTSLLGRFKQECPNEVRYVPFDCKGGVSVAAFLSQIVVDLGREQFPSFASEVNGFIKGGVDFSENDIAAENTISIAINSNVDAAAQEYRLAQLQGAFFADLAKLNHRTVIALDTYQLANKTLQNWIESTWLRAVGRRQLNNIVTVVAGQSIPDPNSAVWGSECEHFPLEPIVELAEWCRFCSDLSEDMVKAAMILNHGHPLTVHQALLTLAKRCSA